MPPTFCLIVSFLSESCLAEDVIASRSLECSSAGGKSELRAGLLKTKFHSVGVCLYAYLKSIATKPLQ